MGVTNCCSRERTKRSMAIMPLQWDQVDLFLKSVQEAEDILGEPPTIMQVFYIIESRYNMQFKSLYQVVGMMVNVYREDLLYTDAPAAYRWTCHKREGFMNYSEIFDKHF